MHRAALILSALALAACDRAPRAEAPRQTDRTGSVPAAQPLLGGWTSAAAVDHSSDGVRMRSSDARVRYAQDGRFERTEHLTIFGPRLPADGLGFAVSTGGRWQRQGDRLIEDVDQARIVPDHEDGELRRLSGMMEDELVDAPPSAATVRMDGAALVVAGETGERRYGRE